MFRMNEKTKWGECRVCITSFYFDFDRMINKSEDNYLVK